MAKVQRNKPIVALTLGDASGIGSELVAKLLTMPDINAQAHVVLVGDEWQWLQGQRIADASLSLPVVAGFSEVMHYPDTPVFLQVNRLQQDQATIAKESAACGRAVLNVLEQCMDGALSGAVDAICFAPLNKLAMKMGGLVYEDELHFFANHLKVSSYFCEFNTLGDLWTSRISSHIPLKDAYQYLTVERIKEASQLIYNTLKLVGYEAPRVAVAAFNPHAGEGGTCGKEEIEVIRPAVEACQAEGYAIDGPYPADTIFIKAQNKELDAVVTMYHDQGQIALKLMGFARGVTVQGGLPIAITTPAHGTAFDIAGKGQANVGPMRNAFDIACRIGNSRWAGSEV
ncbi:MAG: 4-hydroxythreonine-4-phosphate dehydrogenase PdxA [Ostreibacterium sp.]